MYTAALAFIAGVLTLPYFTALPTLYGFLPALAGTALLWYGAAQKYRSFWKIGFSGLLGCSFVLLYSQSILAWQLPKELETKTVTIRGTIVSLPVLSLSETKKPGAEESSIHFTFALEALNAQAQKTTVQLHWYHYTGIPTLHAGEKWQLEVRLKRPHSLLNPGGFDYEKWLFSKGIRATGYVVNPGQARKLSDSSWRYAVTQVRAYLQQKIHLHLQGEPTEGLISALIMGAQDGIRSEQWQIMRATGTNHLMAIAGVHIAFVSGFLYTFVNFLWRRSPRCVLALPAQTAAACAALITAILYSALAGFALPTQRALIMLFVLMMGLLLRRTLHPWNAFLLALLLIVLWDPLSTLSISFWLSFGAVFAIIYGISGRIKPSGLWWKYGRVQWVITLALIPMTLLLFQQSSLISLVANLIAVPAVGILVLPLCLSGALLALIFPFLGHGLLWTSAKIIAVIWEVLRWLGNIEGAVWQHSVPNVWVLLAAAIGILWLLAPGGFPARGMGLFWISPMLFYFPAAPSAGIAKLTLLDVGQGLSAVVQTQHHALVFDTGLPMGKNEDTAGRVILPFLQTAGIHTIDTLIVSHGDADHIGGARTLLQGIPVRQIQSSVPRHAAFENRRAETCRAGEKWKWDGVTFQLLYPPPALLGQGNNSSCVLRVATKTGALLLTGDIEKPAENYLVKQYQKTAQAEAGSSEENTLSATILIAPHHGSRTSSTPDFISAVHPTYVFFPTGYKNRYRFPNKIILERYKQAGVRMLNATETGAISIELGGSKEIAVRTERVKEKKIWHEA
jgi:competence protein ComEC